MRRQRLSTLLKARRLPAFGTTNGRAENTFCGTSTRLALTSCDDDRTRDSCRPPPSSVALDDSSACLFEISVFETVNAARQPRLVEYEQAVGRALATTEDPDYDADNMLYTGEQNIMIRPYPLPSTVKVYFCALVQCCMQCTKADKLLT